MSEAMSLWTEEQAYVRPSLAEYVSGPRNGLSCVGSFSGCGGSSLGLKAAGWDVKVAIEFIPAAAETYRANFPGTNLLEKDIRDVKVGEVLDALRLSGREQLDLFEGSPPCASFSSAGMRERGWGEVKKYSDSSQRTDDLFWEWTRLLEGLQPRAFIAENVPGMIKGNAMDYANRLTDDLARLGYRVHSRVLNAASYGTPQVRERLIFIGFREDQDVQWEWPARRDAPFTTRQALASVDAEDPDHAAWLEECSMEGKAVGRTWAWKKGLLPKDVCLRCGEKLDMGSHGLAAKKVGSVKKSKEGDTRRVKEHWVCADGEPAGEVKDYFLLTVPELDRPCPTITATGSQVGAASVVHPTECRKFTPAEAKALCGFPADFVLTGTREQRYERMGRAVPPPMYEALGRRLAEALS